MADDNNTGKPKTNKQKKAPGAPPLNIDVDNKTIKIGKASLKPEDAIAYGEKIVKLANVAKEL